MQNIHLDLQEVLSSIQEGMLDHLHTKASPIEIELKVFYLIELMLHDKVDDMLYKDIKK